MAFFHAGAIKHTIRGGNNVTLAQEATEETHLTQLFKVLQKVRNFYVQTGMHSILVQTVLHLTFQGPALNTLWDRFK